VRTSLGCTHRPAGLAGAWGPPQDPQWRATRRKKRTSTLRITPSFQPHFRMVRSASRCVYANHLLFFLHTVVLPCSCCACAAHTRARWRSPRPTLVSRTSDTGAPKPNSSVCFPTTSHIHFKTCGCDAGQRQEHRQERQRLRAAAAPAPTILLHQRRPSTRLCRHRTLTSAGWVVGQRQGRREGEARQRRRAAAAQAQRGPGGAPGRAGASLVSLLRVR